MSRHDELYPLILVEAPGCPEPTIDAAINRACWEFCEHSLAWQEDLDAVPVRAGTDVYEFDIPSQSLLVAIVSAKLDGSTIDAGRSYSLPTWLEVRLHPTPGGDGSLALRAALKPALNASSLPGILTTRYADAVAEGAKSRIKRMVGKAWSDPAGAAVCDQEFRRLTAEARIASEVNRVRGPVSVRPRAFGG